MPYTSEKISVKNTKYDRRQKIYDAQKEEIRKLRLSGLTYQKIADMYGCSKSLVIDICNPEIAERKRIASRERHREGRYAYTKEEWAAVMREHRAYKYRLYKEGKI